MANMQAGSRFRLGVLSASAGAILWGFSGSCAQYLYEHYTIDPAFMTAARSLVSGMLFLLFILCTKRDVLVRMLQDAPSRGHVIFLGVGIFLSQFTFVSSVAATNAGTACVLQSLATVFGLVVTCVRRHRLPRVIELCGVVCAVVATWLIATGGDFTQLSLPVAGIVWGIINALAVTLYIMAPHRLYPQWGTMPVISAGMIAAMLVGQIVWALGGLWGNPPQIPVLDVWGIVVLVVGVGALGTFLSFGLYLYGVAKVGSIYGSLLGTFEPASAMILAVVWLGTAMTGADWAGLVLMIAMVFLVTLSPLLTKTSQSNS